eukprot:scaffold15258_cov49-Attheya_sp.AAC.1
MPGIPKQGSTYLYRTYHATSFDVAAIAYVLELVDEVARVVKMLGLINGNGVIGNNSYDDGWSSPPSSQELFPIIPLPYLHTSFPFLLPPRPLFIHALHFHLSF